MSASDDLRRFDAIAAALNRGLNVDAVPWGQLLAVGQKELGRYQQRRALESAHDLYEEETASSLIAAARIILEVASRTPVDRDDNASFDDFSCAEISDGIERQRLLLLSSCAFAMYGNFASAAAVQRSLTLTNLQTEGQLLTLAISNPRQIPTVLQSEYLTPNARGFLEKLNFFLFTGDEGLDNSLIASFEELMRDPRAPLETILLRCARLALKHITILATSNLLKTKLGVVLEGFVTRIISDGRHCLLPPQYTLIHRFQFLQTNANTIVTIPTSTGKTLLGELAIAASLRNRGDIAIYVTPYIALGRQGCVIK